MTNPYPVVLYVEDDTRSRKVMSVLLKQEMNLEHVTIFEDSANFGERVAALDPKPEVIFLDIHMKPLDGFEMLQILQRMRKFETTPVVALTASVMSEEVQRLRTAGFRGCLAKPLDAETFSSDLNLILSGEAVWRIVVS